MPLCCLIKIINNGSLLMQAECTPPAQNKYVYQSSYLTNINQVLIQKHEKLFAILNAAFEGIGISGIITAALWYITAPMAPEGFKGPISTLTIAISTAMSFVMAIPVAYIAFKKFIKNIELFCLEYTQASQLFNHHLQDFQLELLRLRVLFASDNEFLSYIKSLIKSSHIKLYALNTCKIYSVFKTKKYLIKWDSNHTLSLIAHDKGNEGNAILFIQLLKDSECTNILAFRKATINLISHLLIANQNIKNKAPHNPNKNIIYATIAAITCAEVLLSIAWTISSILIGMKIITPISDLCWSLYAFTCIALALLFGIGIFCNKVNESKRNALKNAMQLQITTLLATKENLHALFSKKLLTNKNFHTHLINYRMIPNHNVGFNS